MRNLLIAANWKMNKTVPDSLKFFAILTSDLKAVGNVEVVLAPPFTALYSMGVAMTDSDFTLAAQNMHWEESGAFTGEISPSFLADVGCKYVILGHSERRWIFGETDETINKKVLSSFKHGLVPILCVGEKLDDRDSGRTEGVVSEQLKLGLAGADLARSNNLVIAYEPVWAIGTGKTASPQQAEDVHSFIRNWIRTEISSEVAGRTQIIYGGSVKPANSRALLSMEDIDGFLVGGASLEPSSFAEIVRSAH